MPKIQYQRGSLVTSIPKEVKDLLGIKTGDYVNFNILKNGQVRIIKIEEESK